MNKYLAEFIGTGILVFFAVGSAVFGLPAIGALGVALAFGLVLLGLAFTIGPISGCHVNPAVTVGMVLAGRMRSSDAVPYIVAQVLGGILGASLIKLVSSVGDAKMHVTGANSFGSGSGINMGGAFILEIILTFLLVFVVLLVTKGKDNHNYAGIAIGLTLGAIHLVGIPLDGTSVNPARSIGPALFAGGTAISQLWLFIVAPLVGAVVAVAAARALTATPGSATDSASTTNSSMV